MAQHSSYNSFFVCLCLIEGCLGTAQEGLHWRRWRLHPAQLSRQKCTMDVCRRSLAVFQVSGLHITQPHPMKLQVYVCRYSIYSTSLEYTHSWCTVATFGIVHDWCSTQVVEVQVDALWWCMCLVACSLIDSSNCISLAMPNPSSKQSWNWLLLHTVLYGHWLCRGIWHNYIPAHTLYAIAILLAI